MRVQDQLLQLELTVFPRGIPDPTVSSETSSRDDSSGTSSWREFLSVKKGEKE